MKRSDAIKQLKYWLFGASNNPNHQNEATALLNKIEQMGLLPPTNEEKSFRLLPDGQMTYQVNEWEPEELIVTNVDIKNKTVTFKTVVDDE